MNEKETKKKISLLDREVTVLTEHLDRTKLDLRGELDALRIEVETLKTFLAHHQPEFYSTFQEMKTQNLREVNPEWIAGKSDSA